MAGFAMTSRPYKLSSSWNPVPGNGLDMESEIAETLRYDGRDEWMESHGASEAVTDEQFDWGLSTRPDGEGKLADLCYDQMWTSTVWGRPFDAPDNESRLESCRSCRNTSSLSGTERQSNEPICSHAAYDMRHQHTNKELSGIIPSSSSGPHGKLQDERFPDQSQCDLEPGVSSTPVDRHGMSSWLDGAEHVNERKRKVSSKSVAQETHDSRKDKQPSAKKTPHNMIEKRYRTNLNNKFAALRECVPGLRIQPGIEGGSDEEQEGQDTLTLIPSQKINKAVILSKAMEYMELLETRNERLGDENCALRDRLDAFENLALANPTRMGPDIARTSAPQTQKDQLANVPARAYDISQRQFRGSTEQPTGYQTQEVRSRGGDHHD